MGEYKNENQVKNDKKMGKYKDKNQEKFLGFDGQKSGKI